MTGVDLLLAVAGGAVTIMVVLGMILITPRGQVEVAADSAADPAEPAVTQAPDERRFGPHPALTSLHPQEAAVDATAHDSR